MILPIFFLLAATGATVAPDSADQAKLLAASGREQLARCGKTEAALAALPDTAWLPLPDAAEAHRALRRALSEAIPAASTMILVHANGGDLATTEFSIVIARGNDEVWHGTAVGRTQIWIPDTPPTILPRKEWTLSAESGRRLDAIIRDRCLYAEPGNFYTKEAPPVGALGYQLDIVTPSHRRAASFSGGGALGLTKEIVALAQPPE